MKRTRQFFLRRLLAIYLPSLVIGAALFVPFAALMNGATFLGAAMLFGATVAMASDAAACASQL